MKLLFVHQNYPAQFLHLAPEMQRLGHDVRALTDSPHLAGLRHLDLSGVTLSEAMLAALVDSKGLGKLVSLELRYSVAAGARGKLRERFPDAVVVIE